MALGGWFEHGARENQRPPEGDWRTWLLLAGRGFGKTRTLVEWAHRQAMERPGSRGAIIAATAPDVIDVLVTGESGFLSVIPPLERPTFKVSGKEKGLTWFNGSRALLYTAEKPNRLRGPQFHWAVGDEYAAWRYPEALDMLRFGLRLGDDPKVVLATTPKPLQHVKDLLAEKYLVKSTGKTFDNRENLAPQFISQILEKYENTRLGRQEIDGELLADVEGALWTLGLIDDTKLKSREEIVMLQRREGLNRVLVGVDPKVKTRATSETGIVVGGRGIDGHAYVLDDKSIDASPMEWAEVVVATYHKWRANGVVVETNQGGDLVSTVLRQVEGGVNLPIIEVNASTGKQARAEPVVMLYEQKRIHHAGTFATLEQQMVEWIPASNMPSPDRLDALVWVVTELMQLHENRKKEVTFIPARR